MSKSPHTGEYHIFNLRACDIVRTMAYTSDEDGRRVRSEAEREVDEMNVECDVNTYIILQTVDT